MDTTDGQVFEMSTRHEDDVFEGAKDLLALVTDPIDQLEGQIGEFSIGVDEGLEKDQSRVDLFSETFRKDISLVKYFLHLIHPQFLNQ